MNELTYHTGVIRSSVAVLVFKLILAVAIVDVAYGLVDSALNLYLSIPLEWHHHLSVGLVALLAFKMILEVVLILYVALDWTHRTFEFKGQNFIIKRGLWTGDEEVYELDNLRLISIKESGWSRLLGFGNIMLWSNEPGHKGTIPIMNVSNPHQYESVFKRSIGAAQ